MTKIFNRPVCFFLGIILTLALMPIINLFKNFFFGFEILSVASFPRYHIARLYSRDGLGDQTFSLEVDGKTIYVSFDMAPGNLHEKLLWDETGEIVTLELAGKKIITYDAESKIEIKE